MTSETLIFVCLLGVAVIKATGGTYDKMPERCRFDEAKVVSMEDVKIGIRTVESIFDLEKRDQGEWKDDQHGNRNFINKYSKEDYNYNISKVNKNIYLVFATSVKYPDMVERVHLQRQDIVLKFKEGKQ